MKKSRISNLKELREERERLNLSSELTLREMSHGVGLMRSELKSFLLKKVALPAGATLAAGILVKKLTEDENKEKQTVKNQNSGGWVKIIMSLVPLAMKLLEENKKKPTQVAVPRTDYAVPQHQSVPEEVNV